MTRIRLRYVDEYRDRHGKLRRYFRRPGSRAIPLPGSARLNRVHDRVPSCDGSQSPSPTLAAACDPGFARGGRCRVFSVSRFCRNLSRSSQASYQLAPQTNFSCSRSSPCGGEMPKISARRIIEEIGATRPAMANLTRAVLSKVMTYAIETGERIDNPFAGLSVRPESS